MNLFLMRHASAGTRRVNPLLDLKRPLDKDGKRHCLHLSLVLNAMPVQFDLIVSSPLKRCLQTAQLLATETGYESRILTSNALAPAATLQQFQKLLREFGAVENVLLVGHNPNLSLFLGSLVAPVPAGAAGKRERACAASQRVSGAPIGTARRGCDAAVAA